jgi:hypothetical protein
MNGNPHTGVCRPLAANAKRQPRSALAAEAAVAILNVKFNYTPPMHIQ